MYLRIANNDSHSITIQFDDITMKSKLVVNTKLIAILFHEKSFLSVIFGFTPHWDYKHSNEYICQKVIILSKIDKVPLKYNIIDGSLVNGIQEPILFNFILDKPPW